MSIRLRRRATLAAVLLPLCAAIAAPDAAIASPPGGDDFVVYTETNAPSGNQIIALQRYGDTFREVARYPAGGTGTGAGLGSQGAVTVSGGFLFAVNAGSNQLSVFRIGDHGALQLTDVQPTAGLTPVSVAVRHRVVYVVNAGDSSLTGFRRGPDGHLTSLGVRQVLPGSGAAQLSFDRTGSRLIVTEKGTDTIDVLPVVGGVAGPAVSNPSTGQTPFGFAVDRANHVIVSNAAGGAAGASTLTSYALAGPTGLATISPTVADSQTAACWVQLSGNGRFAFTTNTGSGTISSYRLGQDGSLSLLAAVAASPGAGPIDMARGGRILFTLNAGAHTISTDAIRSQGQLEPGITATVPTGVVGLAVASTDTDSEERR
jgi:6-phosphogluconolactonase